MSEEEKDEKPKVKVCSLLENIPSKLSTIFDPEVYEYVSPEQKSEAKIVLAPNLESVEAFQKLIVVNSDIEKIQDNNVAFINTDELSIDILRLLITRFLGAPSAIQFEEAFNETLNQTSSVKISESLETGYAQDLILKDMALKGVNTVLVRNYLSHMMGFLNYLNQSEIVSYPFEIDFGFNSETAVIQLVVHAEQFFRDYLEQSFENKNYINPYPSQFYLAYHHAHLTDIFYLKKSKKAVITSVWGVGIDGSQPFNPSLFIHAVESFKEYNGGLKNKATPKILTDSKKVSGNNIPLDGTAAKKLQVEEVIDVDHPVIVAEVVGWLLEKITNEDIQFDPTSIDYSFVEELLVDYDKKPQLKKLNDNDKENILKDLKDLKFATKLQEVIGDDEDLGEETTMVKGSKEDLTEETQMIKGSKEDLTEPTQIVKGSKEEENKSKVVIKGSPQENQKEAVTVIKGGGDFESTKGQFGFKDLSKEIWENKKTEIAEKIRRKTREMKEQGLDLDAIDDEIQKIVQAELNGDPNAGGNFVQTIKSDAKDSIVADKVKQNAEDVRVRMAQERHEQELNKREQQILKMKKLIDSMKGELVAAKQNDSSKENEMLQKELSKVSKELEDHKELLKESQGDLKDASKAAKNASAAGNENMANMERIGELEDENIKINKELKKAKAKEKEIESVTRKYDQELAKSLDQIKKLEKKCLDMGATADELKGIASEVKALEKENLTLQNKVGVKEKEVSALSNKIDQAKGEIQNMSADQQLSEMMAKLEGSMAESDDLRMDKKKLESKIKDLEKTIKEKNEQLSKSQSTTEGTVGDKGAGSDEMKKELDAAKAEAKKQAEQAKAISLKVKQYEQKVKFLTAQLEKHNKAQSRGAQGKSNSGGAAQSANEKRLEMIAKKLQDQNKKQAEEMANSKKDLVKMKSENTQLQNKLKEMQRKIAKLEGNKKAA